MCVCVDVLHHEIPSDIRLFGFHVKLFRSDLSGPCIPERDFWLHSLVFTFVSKFVIIYDLSFINSSIFHHSPIHQSSTHHAFSSSFLSHSHRPSSCRSQVQRTWNLRLTWRNLPGLRWMRPINLKGLHGPMVDGGTRWMVINKFMKKWPRFVNLLYFFPILHDILVGDLRCFHFLGFGMWMVDVQ